MALQLASKVKTISHFNIRHNLTTVHKEKTNWCALLTVLTNVWYRVCQMLKRNYFHCNNNNAGNVSVYKKKMSKSDPRKDFLARRVPLEVVITATPMTDVERHFVS